MPTTARKTPRLSDLPMADQLFLWTVRHVICASEDAAPMSHRVRKFYMDAGLPDAVSLTIEMIHALSATAVRPMTVNVPGGPHVLADEEALLSDLRANANAPTGLFALRGKTNGAGAERVARGLHDVARQFAALDARRNLGNSGKAPEDRPAAPTFGSLRSAPAPA
ncbi:MAG: hypothetical protein AAF610_02565 [Pseudomonadota bacterium]